MTVEELAAYSNLSAKQVARFIYLLEDQQYVFDKRVRANGTIEYRLIVVPSPQLERVTVALDVHSKQLRNGTRCAG